MDVVETLPPQESRRAKVAADNTSKPQDLHYFWRLVHLNHCSYATLDDMV